MKVKTSELNGQPLAWAVASIRSTVEVVEREPLEIPMDGSIPFYIYTSNSGLKIVCLYTGEPFAPHRNWDQGGSILDLEEVSIDYRDNETQARKWSDEKQEFVTSHAGKRQGLLAGMRALVAFYLGNEVQIPDSLLN